MKRNSILNINQDYETVCRLYKENGLEHYMLNSAEDAKKVHGFDYTETPGFVELSDENKKLFNEFIVNFMNGLSMNTKITMCPKYVHYVTETKLYRYCVDEDTGDKRLDHLGSIVNINKLDGSKEVLTQFFYEDDVTMKDVTQKREETYLRVCWAYTTGNEEWYHVIAPRKWY